MRNIKSVCLFWLGCESRKGHNQFLRSRQTYKVKLTGDAMNKRDVSADKQLLFKLQDRLLTTSMRCKAQKTHLMSQEPVEKGDTSLPFLYQG
jgi:hypothetical protein